VQLAIPRLGITFAEFGQISALWAVLLQHMPFLQKKTHIFGKLNPKLVIFIIFLVLRAFCFVSYENVTKLLICSLKHFFGVDTKLMQRRSDQKTPQYCAACQL
jgi:hypothetical protein